MNFHALGMYIWIRWMDKCLPPCSPHLIGDSMAGKWDVSGQQLGTACEFWGREAAVSWGSPPLMSYRTIRVEWAAEIDCPWGRNQLPGADCQNNRSEFSQGWAMHLARGSTLWVMSEAELQIHVAHSGKCNQSLKTASLKFCQLIRQVCWATGPVLSFFSFFFLFFKQKNKLNYRFPLDSKFLDWFYLSFGCRRENCSKSLEDISKNTELRVKSDLTLVLLLKKFGSVG